MTTRTRLPLQLLLTALTLLVCGLPARADLIISAGSSVAAPGSTGNSFDVDLTNTGPSAVTLGAFSFGLLLSDTDITLTEANIDTASPYIFLADSFFGPLISTTVGSSLVASDLELSGMGVTVGSGATVGLGHVLFNVASSATTGSFDVAFSGWPATSLSDALENDVPVTIVRSGSIRIESVPEPATAFVAAGLLLFALFCSRPGAGARRSR